MTTNNTLKLISEYVVAGVANPVPSAQDIHYWADIRDDHFEGARTPQHWKVYDPSGNIKNLSLFHYGEGGTIPEYAWEADIIWCCHPELLPEGLKAKHLAPSWWRGVCRSSMSVDELAHSAIIRFYIDEAEYISAPVVPQQQPTATSSPWRKWIVGLASAVMGVYITTQIPMPWETGGFVEDTTTPTQEIVHERE